MRASEETSAQRHERWRALRAHLRAVGLSEDPPDDLLLDPEPTTRPNVRLVAHYDGIRQASLGDSTVAELVGPALATIALLFALLALGEQLSPPMGNPWLTVGFRVVLLLVLLAVFMKPLMRLLALMVVRRGSLTLTLEELSMSWPGRNRHARWIDVYAVFVHQEGKRFSRRWTSWFGRREAPCIKVELNDGLVARLYVADIDRQPLADLMNDFVVHHRGNHTAAPGAAS